MNRRSLLRTLAALSVSGSSVAVLASISSGATELRLRSNVLADLLIRSRRSCQQLCHGLSSSSSSPSGICSPTQELSPLIEQALLRLDESKTPSAAFWQSCSDAFVRTVNQLETLKSHPSCALIQIDDIQRTFCITAECLNQQTAITIATARRGEIA